MNIADKSTLDSVSIRVNKIGNYIGYRNTTTTMRYYLPSGTRIFCDRRKVEVLQKNNDPILIDEGYEISEDGLVTIVSTEGNIESVVYNIL